MSDAFVGLLLITYLTCPFPACGRTAGNSSLKMYMKELVLYVIIVTLRQACDFVCLNCKNLIKQIKRREFCFVKIIKTVS
jgi:hypothetical protein